MNPGTLVRATVYASLGGLDQRGGGSYRWNGSDDVDVEEHTPGIVIAVAAIDQGRIGDSEPKEGIYVLTPTMMGWDIGGDGEYWTSEL